MTLKKDTKTPKTKKPIYKRIWFWILIVFILFAAVGGKVNKSSETASPAADAATESVSSSLSAPLRGVRSNIFSIRLFRHVIIVTFTIERR